jgi:hypothetical protein
MAPDVTKVDADRQISNAPPARNFRDEVMCSVFFMGNRLPSRRPAYPIYDDCRSSFPIGRGRSIK